MGHNGRPSCTPGGGADRGRPGHSIGRLSEKRRLGEDLAPGQVSDTSCSKVASRIVSAQIQMSAYRKLTLTLLE
jgi:hypothetical protein